MLDSVPRYGHLTLDMNRSGKGLSAGALARSSGVNVETLRYYERRGLLPRPPRTDGGYRRYPEETVRRLRFVKRAQALGFSLEEIRELLSMRVDPRGRRCEAVRLRAAGKVGEVREKIAALRRIERALGRLVEACEGRRGTSTCPILNALDESEER